MTKTQASRRVITERLALVERMVDQLRALPSDDLETFLADSRNVWTAEACLRRSLEALLDIGRHILAKAYGIPAVSYKDIAAQLGKVGVLSPDEAALFREMAGYRNRMVHFYYELSAEELYQISANRLEDLAAMQAAYRRWMLANAEKLDRPLE